MKSGVCPKCESREVYYREGGGSMRDITIPLSMWALTPVMRYLCANCGHLELYLSDRDAIEKLKQKWDKVN